MMNGIEFIIFCTNLETDETEDIRFVFVKKDLQCLRDQPEVNVYIDLYDDLRE